jgi:hypothetical protein
VHKGSALGTQRYAVEQARQAADRADDAAIQCHADAATQTGQGTVAPLMPLSCVIAVRRPVPRHRMLGWRSLEAIIGWRGLAEGWQSLGAEMEPGQVWPNLI